MNQEGLSRAMCFLTMNNIAPNCLKIPAGSTKKHSYRYLTADSFNCASGAVFVDQLENLKRGLRVEFDSTRNPCFAFLTQRLSHRRRTISHRRRATILYYTISHRRWTILYYTISICTILYLYLYL
eukprot:SAG31_NODE_14119_length_826_cov_1.475928_1_plen_126_part_10